MVGFNERFFFSLFVAPQYIGKVSNIHGIWTTNPPQKKQPGPRFMGAKWCKQTTWIPNSCLFRWKHCDTSHVYQSIDCRFGAWDFVKKTKLFIDTQRRLIVLKDPQPKAKQLQSIRGPLGLESGPRVPQKTVDLSSHTSCLGASIPRQKAVVCWSPE